MYVDIYIMFCYAFIEGHLGCFHLLAVLNDAAMNICIYMFI